MKTKDVYTADIVSEAKANHRKVPRISSTTLDPFSENAPTADELHALVGTETSDAAIGIVCAGIESLSGNSLIYRQFFLAMFAEEKPQTAIEAMLLVQMFNVHVQTMKLSNHANAAKSSDARAALSKAANSSSRTFVDQMMAMKKYRSKVSQTVRIEHVTVNEGGKAIVGNVGQSGGGG